MKQNIDIDGIISMLPKNTGTGVYEIQYVICMCNLFQMCDSNAFTGH